MSYQGRDEFLCVNGHLSVYDALESTETASWTCPVCHDCLAMSFSIDETNDHDGVTTPILTVESPAKNHECPACGQTHCAEPARYLVPLRQQDVEWEWLRHCSHCNETTAHKTVPPDDHMASHVKCLACSKESTR